VFLVGSPGSSSLLTGAQALLRLKDQADNSAADAAIAAEELAQQSACVEWE
jgi:hypothetical protein